ncbi:hypothetical protein L3i22_033790 [Actinoplanes sp. L3-i22]|nr:hypothetical protein L3i22_033790 [Actinoplanes sp. L3-i22]
METLPINKRRMETGGGSVTAGQVKGDVGGQVHLVRQGTQDSKETGRLARLRADLEGGPDRPPGPTPGNSGAVLPLRGQTPAGHWNEACRPPWNCR